MSEAAQRFNVLGVGISAITMDDAVRILADAVAERKKGYVCVTPVHGVMEAQTDPALRRILNSSLLTTPDGMPLVWIGRWLGHRNMGRVYGPELMLEICRRSPEKGWSHFLYGGKPGIADELAKRLSTRFPGLKIAGTFTPPFRPLNGDEERELARMVSESKPDFLWVGISTPKQDRFMSEYLAKLDATVMLGVGAAFDMHTGHIKDAPSWIKRAGLQWVHRLFQEPRRLWRRYLILNPIFVFKITMQFLGIVKYKMQ